MVTLVSIPLHYQLFVATTAIKANDLRLLFFTESRIKVQKLFAPRHTTAQKNVLGLH